MTDDTSEFVGHEPCPECGSKDNLARYSDGHAYCFGCSYYEPGDGSEAQPSQRRRRMADFVEGEFQALGKRRLTEETCRKFGYRTGTFKDKPVQIADYFDPAGNAVVAQKVRFANKDFIVVGNMKEAGLYGQHLWRDQGKMVVVTEGEIDALTVSQLQENRWPVVSVPNGAQGAKKALQKHLDWLLGFETVTLFFDNDEPGKKAVSECAALFPPGRLKVARMASFKDPSEALQAGKGKEVIDAIWGAKTYRPDGIVSGAEITKDSLRSGLSKGYPLPYTRLNDMLHGLRKRELTLLTAGSGIGKSTLAREVAYHLHQDHGLTIGNVYLEESKEKTAQGYIAIHNDIPLGCLRERPDLLTEEQWDASLAAVIHNRMFFYDHFGSLDSDNLLAKLRYMAVGLGVDFIILDHISIVVSGQESSSEGERKDIDRLMTKLRSLVEETGVGVIAIVHLKQPEGRPHEEGGRVTLSQLRGSGALKQLSDNVIALERNQQDEDAKDLSLIRLLKNREFGDVGEADTVRYHRDTGRLLEASPDFQDEPGPAKADEDDEIPF